MTPPPPRTRQPRTVPLAKRLTGLAQDSVVYGAANLLDRIAHFLLLPVFTAYLSPHDFALVAICALVSGVFQPLGTVGVRAVVFRFYQKYTDEAERQRLLGSALLVVSVVAPCLLLLTFPLAGPIGALLTGGERIDSLVRVALATAFLACFTVPGNALLRAQRRARAAAGVSLVRSLTGIGLGLYLVVGQGMGAAGVVLGLLGGALAGLACHLALTLPQMPILRADAGMIRSKLGFALPMVPHLLLGLLLARLIEPVLAHLLGLEQLGLYNVALRFALPLTLAVSIVQKAWGPFRYQIYEEDGDPASAYRSIANYYTIAVAGGWLVIAVWGPELLRGMTAAPYHGAAGLVPLVGLIPVSQGLYYMLQGAFGMERTRGYPLASLTGVVTLVGAALVLVPALGLAGAPLSVIVARLTSTTLLNRMGQHQLRVAYDWGHLVRVFGLAGVAWAPSLLLQDAEWPVRIAVAAGATLLYPLLAGGALLLQDGERERMLRTLRRFRTRPSPS